MVLETHYDNPGMETGIVNIHMHIGMLGLPKYGPFLYLSNKEYSHGNTIFFPQVSFHCTTWSW